MSDTTNGLKLGHQAEPKINRLCRFHLCGLGDLGLRQKETGRRQTSGRLMKRERVAYFFGLHFSQVAQVLPASAQHFMVQEAVSFLVQQLLLEAQPVKPSATQASVTQRTRSFTVFIVGGF
jgi:hypothetical protein